jgi:hypothetical protein
MASVQTTTMDELIPRNKSKELFSLLNGKFGKVTDFLAILVVAYGKVLAHGLT